MLTVEIVRNYLTITFNPVVESSLRNAISLQIPAQGPHPDWLICGGESGPGARNMEPEWARWILIDCLRAGVSFFMKQMAKKAPIPDDLLIRQWPEAA